MRCNLYGVLRRQQETGWDGIARYLLSLLMIIAHPIRIHSPQVAHKPAAATRAAPTRSPPPPAWFPRSPSGRRESACMGRICLRRRLPRLLTEDSASSFPLFFFFHLLLASPNL